MGRFPWTNGHSKQGSDHRHVLPQEWFSKSNLEPSRQALSDLMKEHGPTKSEGSIRIRSRSNTVSSHRSFHTRSSSEYGKNLQSRPASRQSMVDDHPSSAERLESSGRAFLSKSTRLIRRQGSKLNLLPAQLEDTNRCEDDAAKGGHDTSPVSPSTPGLGFSPKRELARNISAPFGFQHVTHTDQGHFQSLSKATKTELVSEFTAMQAGQEPVTEIKGIPVDDLPPSRASPDLDEDSQPRSPTPSVLQDLPLTPPRPEPPPKDNVQSPSTPADVRLSRSMENFSRPTRSPVAGFEISPFGDNSTRLSLMRPTSGLVASPPSPTGWAELTFDSLMNSTAPHRNSVVHPVVQTKPLPLLPTVVHAVSTNDDSALHLRSIPLPQPPLPDVPEEEDVPLMTSPANEPPTSHRSLLRHAQTFPSSKASRRRSLSAGDIKYESVDANLAANEADPAKSASRKKRISIGLKTIDINGWEDAIDYSWDHPADLEDDDLVEQHQDEPSTPADEEQQETFLVVQQPQVDLVSSSSSTPLMMRQSLKANHIEEPLPSPTVGHAEQQFQCVGAALQGLGIDSIRPAPVLEYEGFFHPRGQAQRPVRRDSLVPGLRRDPGTPMSTSSSQDSLILSIASSIMGTHRSSKSSTSLSDFAQLVNFDEPTGKDVASTLSEAGEGHSSDTSQETVKTDVRTASIASSGVAAGPAATPLETSPELLHGRVASASQIPVPKRTSSIAAADASRPMQPITRKRSNTANARSRYNARTSYSLFPIPQSLTST